jgi:hypothetical protein
LKDTNAGNVEIYQLRDAQTEGCRKQPGFTTPNKQLEIRASAGALLGADTSL